LSAQVCRVPESDRVLVEDSALAGAQGPTVRELERTRAGGARGDRVLERPSPSLRLGPPPAPPAAPPRRPCPAPKGGVNLADAPLSGASAKKGTVPGRRPEHCTQRNPSCVAFLK